MSCECKNPKKHNACKKDYTWNTGSCIYEIKTLSILNSYQLKAVNYFRKTFHLRCLAGI